MDPTADALALFSAIGKEEQGGPKFSRSIRPSQMMATTMAMKSGKCCVQDHIDRGRGKPPVRSKGLREPEGAGEDSPHLGLNIASDF